MSEQNKGHSTMGLPRASGKRSWSGEEGDDSVPPTKVLCTSPPHALCAEDVLHHPTLTHAHASTHAHTAPSECELTSGASDSNTRLEQEDIHAATPSIPTHRHHYAHSSDDDQSDDDFIDDEEDKDSGFIDSNSIDNSSDDETEGRALTSDSSSASSKTSVASTSLQLSLSQVLAPPSAPAPTSTCSVSTFVTSSIASPVVDCIPLSPRPVPPSPHSIPPSAAPTSPPAVPIPHALSPTPHSPTINPPLTLPLTVTPSPISIPVPSPSVVTTTLPSPLPAPASPIVTPAPFSPITILPLSLPLAATTHTSTPPAPLTTITSTTTHTSPSSPAPLLTHSLPSPLALPSPHLTSPSSPVTTSTITTTAGREERSVGMMGGLTTVTATQTATVVTSTYQGALPSPAYEPHPFTYSGEAYPSRPSTPAWESCNYYDGSQPATNKYMEISPTKSSSSQSIQCDENGKSYLELGSASPYTHTFSNECGNYTTSPSGYPQTYNQTYTSPSSYGQPNLYYNPRQSYSPNPYNVYPSGENYTSFEGESGCSYGYGGGAYAGGRSALPPSRGPPRCMSPYCDPTRGNPRPACYHQQRLSVLNLSMFKLNRFRQFPDPSLHRSVLICNTLRHIERELEAEGVSVASLLAHSHAHTTHPHMQGASPSPGTPPCPEPIPSSPPASPAPSEGPLPPMHSPLVGSPLAAPVSPPPSTPTSLANPHYSPSVTSYPAVQYLPEDHTPAYDGRETVHLRTYSALPTHTHTETSQGPSGVEENAAEAEESPVPASPRPQPPQQEERTDAINWCSVLSLSSQTDLDSMNNNEYSEWGGEGSSNMDLTRPEDAPPWKLPSLSADDVLKSFPEASKRLEANEDLDSIINVLVGS